MRRKITMLFAALLTCVGVVKAQITNVSELSNEKIYAIVPQDVTRGVFYATSTSSHLDACGGTRNNAANRDVEINYENPDQQFAFYTHEGNTYLYSVGAGKFVSDVVNSYFPLSELPGYPVSFTETHDGNSGKDYLIIKAKGTEFINVSTGWSFGCVAGWNSIDEGNRLQIVEVSAMPQVTLDYLASIFSSQVDVVYKYKCGEEVWGTETVTVTKGQAYPQPASRLGVEYTLPTGVVANNITAGTEVVISCSLVENELPFAFAANYQSVAHWYYMNIHSDAYYLNYEQGATAITLNQRTVPADSKDAYTWAFVGNPITGYQIVNYLAGAQMILSSSTNTDDGSQGGNVFPVMTNKPVPDGNNTYWIPTLSSNRENGFYLAQKEYAGNRMNKRGSVLAYWTGGADAGSTFVVEERLMNFKPMQDQVASLKENAINTKNELLSISVETVPLAEVVDALDDAIEDATNNVTSTDENVLSATIEKLKAAIALNTNLVFNNGALASLEAGEYVIYYEDENGVNHYMINDKANRKVITSLIPAVYDVTFGNINGGYVSYAYYLDMNESKISNPSDDKTKVQVENKGGSNYGANRIWDSQVLYMNADGKYAIRTTNCKPGSAWSSDCFITVSEDGVTVSGQNTELSDALYKWNVVKASEANIAFELTVDEYKYMTLFVNYAVNVPVGAKAYAVSAVENGVLTLTEVGAVVPENTPVIIEAMADDYAFTYAVPVAAYEGENMLKGSWLDSNVVPSSGRDAYVMALVNGNIVMAKAKLNDGSFKNRANKAYLEIPQEVAAGAPMFSFGRGEGTTGIANLEQDGCVVVYDLLGRRVEKLDKGIYIVNGRKVVVK